MREKIIKLVKEHFLKDPRVFALWLEGADGLGSVDVYSDLDVWFDAADGKEEEVLEDCAKLFASIAPLDQDKRVVHNNTKIYQRNMHIAGSSAYLLLDVCVQSHSRGSEGATFTEGDVAELPLILFDKAGVIRIVPPVPIVVAKEAGETALQFGERARVIKYIRRGLYLEAHAYYEKYVCRPLVRLLRLVYTPCHSDYGLVHISSHLPHAVAAQLEILYQVSSIFDIEDRLPLADELFIQAMDILQKKED